MPKSYAGHVVGKVGNRAVPPKGGNSPTVPSKPPGNRFAKGEIYGNSKHSGKQVLNSREKANEARAIINNEVFKEVLESVKQGLISQWSIAETVSERELCWMKLDALRSISEELGAIIHNDKIINN